MYVYRITLANYADQLYAPGTSGRWNSNGIKLICTAGSGTMACLENLVHRNASVLQSVYCKVITIHVSDSILIEALDVVSLPDDWATDSRQLLTTSIGDKWVARKSGCLLQVPPAIIPAETNFLINPAHPDFQKSALNPSAISHSMHA